MNAQPAYVLHAFSSKHNLGLPRQDSQIIRFPGVYIVWDGDRALYIGSSPNVRKRIQRTKTSVKGRNEAFRRRTHIDVYPCESLQQARHLETELIGIYKPVYNKQGQWQSSRSIQQLKAEHSKLAGAA